MSEQVHLLVVKAGGLTWALPMSSTEQAFYLRDHEVRNVGNVRVVRFRDEVLELIDLAERLGLEPGERPAAVVMWGAGRRFALLVDELVNQISADRVGIPRMAHGEFTDGAVYHKDQVVPILRPGALTGVHEVGDEDATHRFTEMQQSALAEIANIGSGHAATALSTLIGRPVDVGYSKALLTVLARALDELGEPMNRSALVDTPINDDQGNMLLVFPEDAAAQLCELLGTAITEEMGLTALQEVGNILSASYLNAIVAMTGIPLEVEPPYVQVDQLGRMISQSAATVGNANDPTVLMRSYLTVEGSTASFSFLFVPRLKSVEQLLERLGVGV
ncbi:MAG TPA: chemotaxis protein CheC [Solirubrobacteraceae bacterium]|nr:chemotaxis protein CheC [Solirubrobacteraceae bacterium]